MQKTGNDSWSALLREWRRKTGVTQREAAEIAGITYTTYVAYEIGRRNPGAYASGKLAWMVSQTPIGEDESTRILRLLRRFTSLPEEKQILALDYVERILENDERL